MNRVDRWFGHLPLRVVWTLTVVAMVVIVCGLVGGLALWNGHHAVSSLAARLQQSTAARVHQRLDTYLTKPLLINQLNRDAVGLRELDVRDLDALERHALSQLQRFDSVTGISFASVGGEYVGATRGVLVPGIAVARSSQATDFELRVEALDPDGRHLLEGRLPDYDPRARPWYLAAVRAGEPTWTPIYRWSSGDLGIDAVVPIFAADSQPLGVFDTSLSLSAIHTMLRQSLASPNSAIFLIDQAGQLVASSTELPRPIAAEHDAGRLPLASEAGDPIISAALTALDHTPEALVSSNSARSFSFTVRGERQLAQATPYRDAYGLQWLIVTVVPEADVLGPLATSGVTTTALIGGLLIVAIFVAAWMAYRVTQPVTRLHQAVQSLARGEWTLELETTRNDEIGQLGRTFQEMAQQLLRSHRAIYASEARYRSLFEGVPVGLYRITPAGELLASNAAARQILGYDDESLLPQTIADLCVDPQLFSRWLLALEQGQEVRNWHIELRRRDRRAILARVNLRLFRDATGAVQYYEGSLEDITELVETERALREHEARIRAIADNLPNGVIFQVQRTLDGVWRCTYVSGGVTTSWGLSAEQVYADLGVLRQRYSPGDWAQLEATFATSMRTGDAFALESQYSTADGTLRWSLLRAQPRRLDGGVIVWDGVEIDTTAQRQAEGRLRQQHYAYEALLQGLSNLSSERQRLEMQLRQAQKLESIGRLAGGIAHDFNNLLTAVIGNAELALMEVPVDSAGSRELREILQTSGRAAALTRQLLAFSRKQVIEPRVIDLHQLLTNMERLLRLLLGEDIRLTIRSDSEGVVITADPTQIEQVLVNMAVNARDAMPRGGSLDMTLRKQWLAATDAAAVGQLPPGAYALIEIRDSGCGMDATVRERLFEPFFTTKGPERGTGLGLATSYGIVTQHGGQIVVESELGQGTTFHIYLPLSSGARKLAEERDEEALLPRGTETILLAEDEPAVRELIGRVLRGLGYTVLEASDGLSALELGRTKAPDMIHLLISDVVMPGLGGKLLLDALRAHLPNLDALFTSGYPNPSRWSSEQSASGDHFLQKPFAPNALARRVRDLLDRRVER
jgi:PAS domain S-box-containing protein